MSDKPEPLSWLQIQVPTRQKAAWVRAAQAKKLKLAAWASAVLDEAAASNK